MNTADENIQDYRNEVALLQRPRVRTRPGYPARDRCSYCYAAHGFTGERHLRGCEVLESWAETVFAQRARNRGAYDVGELPGEIHGAVHSGDPRYVWVKCP